MEVKLAKTAGFCFGVRRAVDTVYEQARSAGSPIYTYGPIVHNEQVVQDLESRGVQVLENLEELERLETGTVIIRAHGVGREVYERLEKSRLTCVDATCPFVKKIHRIVERESGRGRQILIAGNPAHPEVEGIRGWCSGSVTVLESLEEALNFTVSSDQKLCLVAQTTFNYNKFQDLVEIISKKGYDIIVLNTICSATEERQTEAKQIASEVDAMIVIGGKSSSNTQKLFEICKKECENTYYIQKLVDLDLKTASSIRSVGITAGASTPNKIIEEVQKHVRNQL
ncbi:MAG: 4-hydroxy-3-methylbut-2-enyl diphosphate reductase [Lachnospiraceae bacterium]|jgi:4-hydroxy-3-methylbut-2-enyl diphosphate reductase|nr:4-hydroxy-3-methylbut-2-enyl diphosphate reductase [Lachnospiraceae bacterium]MCI8994714.1 4-hydroxy-3-methylbut-2-enyl diphosphate reductase [Lachnospiraceae bacterium]MCI9135927.1 4-hydroxy-3-methylbut-2-enyl diphosphate reductase [Lachnospiraceae bacterium]